MHNTAKKWKTLWEDYRIVIGRDRLRMGDDSLMGEVFGLFIDGVTDGGATRIDALYDRFEQEFPSEEKIIGLVDQTLQVVLDLFGRIIMNTPLRRGPQFLMLVAAVAGATGNLPVGQLEPWEIATVDEIDGNGASDRLMQLLEALESERAPRAYQYFVEASSGSTQRIATRRIRYLYYRWALIGGGLPELI